MNNNLIRHKKSKLTLNENFFDCIDTEEKAYILGFIAADGSITKYSLRIELQERDKNILEKIKTALNSNATIKISYKETSIGEKAYCRVHFCSKKLILALNKLNIFQNKTQNLQMPNIPDHLFRHFSRGLFDGDGSLSITKSTDKPNYYSCNLNIQKGMTEDFMSVTEKLCGIKFKKRHHPRSYNIVDILTLSTSDMRIYFKWLYEDSKIFLDRKMETYKKYTEHQSLPNKAKKITIEDVSKIRALLKTGLYSCCQIAKMIGNITHPVVTAIRDGKTWKYVK